MENKEDKKVYENSAWSDQGQNTNGPDVKSDEYLCNIYIEGNAHLSKPKMIMPTLGKGFGFSIFAFLIGPIYFMYRKCYLEAAAICGITFLMAFVPADIPAYIFGLVYAFIFYPFYGRRARQAIADARSSGSTEDAIKVLRRKGGTNLPAALVVAGIYTMIVVAAFIELFSAL
ncbi:MAG: DUF2628 domain-containing protein [Clostridiales bacterium]|nr:DUF2628 domain-containing protein [Clostridiales bacterium]